MATAPSQRPMRADAQRNYARLVAAAREAFTELGTEAPLDDIARRAGVGAGTLYRHFPSRVDLMGAVYRNDVEVLSARAYELLEQRPPAEALASWVRLQLGYVRLKRGLAAALIATIGKESELFEYCRETLWAAAGALVSAAQESGDLRRDVRAGDVLKLAHGIALATEHSPEDAERLLAVMLDGLFHPAAGTEADTGAGTGAGTEAGTEAAAAPAGGGS